MQNSPGNQSASKINTDFKKQWYDPDAVTTRDGVLELRFDNFTNHDLNYRSGMVQSWNKMCFRGG